ncbi:aspartic peptidase domain-containing protein [Massariosphaeria phaeospora]|uniref:Aspartic peptidase domain-containing protein n=1 Tax=Massariosphaeria phaeospora TaxID=100035 RepID=A0A7C8HZL4_9PLEO|nr:aspartic peptidase domain-containing protein [Massariosphaeria phaeospora]
MYPTLFTPALAFSIYSCLSGLFLPAHAAAIAANPPIVLPLTKGVHPRDPSIAKRSGAETELIKYGPALSVTVTIRDEPYEMILDSGDPNVWIAQSNFVCVDSKSQSEVPQANCKLGSKLYPGPFPASTAKEADLVYGDGTEISGMWAVTPSLSLNGIKVKDVNMVFADGLAIRGDRHTVGSFGTSWMPGQNSIWMELCKQNNLPTQFTLALDEPLGDGAKAGYLAIGGDIGTQVQVSGSWGTAPLGAGAAKYGGWAFEGAKAKWKDGTKDTVMPLKVEVQLDSGKSAVLSPIFTNQCRPGATSIYLPKNIVDAFAKTFTPVPQYKASENIWKMDCDAKGPATLEFEIGGVDFKIPTRDLLDEDGDCWCALLLFAMEGPGLETVVLGQQFLQNVVVKHDFDQRSMSFKQRV